MWPVKRGRRKHGLGMIWEYPMYRGQALCIRGMHKDLQLKPFDKELLAELYFLIGVTSQPFIKMHWWQKFTTESMWIHTEMPVNHLLFLTFLNWPELMPELLAESQKCLSRSHWKPEITGEFIQLYPKVLSLPAIGIGLHLSQEQTHVRRWNKHLVLAKENRTVLFTWGITITGHSEICNNMRVLYSFWPLEKFGLVCN